MASSVQEVLAGWSIVLLRQDPATSRWRQSEFAAQAVDDLNLRIHDAKQWRLLYVPGLRLVENSNLIQLLLRLGHGAVRLAQVCECNAVGFCQDPHSK